MGQIQYSGKYDEFTSTCALISASFPLRVHHHVSFKYPPKGTSFGLKAGQTIQVGDLMKLSSKQFISTIWDSLNVLFTYGEGSKILIRLGGNMVVLGCSWARRKSSRRRKKEGKEKREIGFAVAKQRLRDWRSRLV